MRNQLLKPLFCLIKVLIIALPLTGCEKQKEYELVNEAYVKDGVPVEDEDVTLYFISMNEHRKEFDQLKP